ncbi:hypothetical protein Tco_1282789 [Tanacetum coccineum]
MIMESMGRYGGYGQSRDSRVWVPDSPQIQTRGREAVVGLYWEEVKKLLIEEYCLKDAIHKLDSKLWNHSMVGRIVEMIGLRKEKAREPTETQRIWDHLKKASIKLNRAPNNNKNGNQMGHAQGWAYVIGAEEAKKETNVVIGEYDIWAMKMEHYLANTDYPIWEVIQNGNGPVSITTDTQGQIKVLPPRTAEEILARERERRARATLLMALPEDHLAKFHKMTDAKEMWDAIRSRFGGNDESKKMQKYILKQQFEGFSVSNSEGLHKGYDRFQSLLSQLEIHGAGVSTEDANQKCWE